MPGDLVPGFSDVGRHESGTLKVGLGDDDPHRRLASAIHFGGVCVGAGLEQRGEGVRGDLVHGTRVVPYPVRPGLLLRIYEAHASALARAGDTVVGAEPVLALFGGEQPAEHDHAVLAAKQLELGIVTGLLLPSPNASLVELVPQPASTAEYQLNVEPDHLRHQLRERGAQNIGGHGQVNLAQTSAQRVGLVHREGAGGNGMHDRRLPRHCRPARQSTGIDVTRADAIRTVVIAFRGQLFGSIRFTHQNARGDQLLRLPPAGAVDVLHHRHRRREPLPRSQTLASQLGPGPARDRTGHPRRKHVEQSPGLSQ